MKPIIATVAYGIVMILSIPLLFLLSLVSGALERDYIGDYIDSLRKGFLGK